MINFEYVSLEEAIKGNYPGVEDYEGKVPEYEYRECLYEFDDDKPVRLIAMDGGEPEDASFGRDYNWIADELNKLAERLENDGIHPAK